MAHSGNPHKAASTTERGYDAAHRRVRDAALAAWQDGDPCSRCEGPMYRGEPVDLDHSDDRADYLGLSHRACNRSHTGRMHRAKRDAVCEHCGLAYSTRWEAQRYCSVPCRRVATARAPRPMVATQLAFTPCTECRALTTRPVYCSDECSRDKARRDARTKKRLAAGNPLDAPVRTWARREEM